MTIYQVPRRSWLSAAAEAVDEGRNFVFPAVEVCKNLEQRLERGRMLDAQALLARTCGPVSPEMLACAFVWPEHRQAFLNMLLRVESQAVKP